MAFTHVLVPTDFSASATYAVRYALEEAALHHATVTLLHVLPPHTGTEVYYITGAPQEEVGFDPALEGRLGASSPPRPTVMLQDHHEAALTHLRDLMAASFHGAWEVEVAAGLPADIIVRVAHERGTDLIVLGTYGTATHAFGSCRRKSRTAGTVPGVDRQGEYRRGGAEERGKCFSLEDSMTALTQ